MDKEVTNFDEFRDGAYYARKAAEHAAQCTEEENARRRENGRKPNTLTDMALLPDYEVSDIPFSPFGRTYTFDN